MVLTAVLTDGWFLGDEPRGPILCFRSGDPNPTLNPDPRMPKFVIFLTNLKAKKYHLHNFMLKILRQKHVLGG